jgi:photosystem II stability/assembly factor-like uncharacterized protein
MSNYVGELLKSADGGASWSKSLASNGEFLRAFRVAPSAPDVVYVAQGDKILKSADGGATWIATGFGPRPAYRLAVDPKNAQVVYASGAGGFSRSEDGGATWTVLRAEPGGGLVHDLEIDPSKPEVLYANAAFEIFKSSDRGATWSSVWKGPEAFSYFDELTVDAAGALYATVSYYGVFRSKDGGATWTRSFPGFHRGTVAADAQPGRLYVGTDASGVSRSDDEGASWTAANHGLRELSFTAVAADPNTPGVIFAIANPEAGYLGLSPQFLLRSTDDGATWTSPFGSPDAFPWANNLVADPSRPGTWYLAYPGGVLKTRDGGASWEDARRGLRFPEFVYTIAIAPSNPDALYSIGWDTFPLCSSGNCPRVVLFRSVDGAAQWRRARVPGLEHPQLLSSLAVDAKDPSTVYAGGGAGLFKSTDGGAKWAKTGSGLRGGIVDLAADPFAANTLLASIWVDHGRKVFRSVDGGTAWRATAGGIPAGVSVGQIAPDSATPGTFYAGTSKGVYVTQDSGVHWKAMNEGLGDLPVWTVAVDPARPGVVYAGRIDGLFELSSSP